MVAQAFIDIDYPGGSSLLLCSLIMSSSHISAPRSCDSRSLACLALTQSLKASLSSDGDLITSPLPTVSSIGEGHTGLISQLQKLGTFSVIWSPCPHVFHIESVSCHRGYHNSLPCSGIVSPVWAGCTYRGHRGVREQGSEQMVFNRSLCNYPRRPPIPLPLLSSSTRNLSSLLTRYPIPLVLYPLSASTPSIEQDAFRSRRLGFFGFSHHGSHPCLDPDSPHTRKRVLRSLPI